MTTEETAKDNPPKRAGAVFVG